MLTTEIKQALGALRARPLSTALLAGILALGFGANTVIFSYVDAVLFRPLSVRHPEALVRIWGPNVGVSYLNFQDYRDAMQSLSGMALYNWRPMHVATADNLPLRVTGGVVHGGFFDVVGVKAQVGRMLSPADDRPGASPVAVLSDRMARRLFASPQQALGAPIRINGHDFSVLGVADNGFLGLSLTRSPDVWLPITLAALVDPVLAPAQLQDPDNVMFAVVGRLREGYSSQQATAELQRLTQAVKGKRLASVEPLASTRDPKSRRVSWALLAIGILVVLMTSADVAVLLLARTERRRKEIAVRLTVGATPMTLAGQLVLESVIIALLGGIGGIVVALGTSGLLSGMAASDMPVAPELASSVLGLRVSVLAGVLSLVWGIVLGLVPAVYVRRADIMAALRGETAGLAGRGYRLSLQTVFLASQVAISAILLIGAGLFLQTLRNASALDLGFRADDVLVGRVDLARQGYDSARGAAFLDPLLERLRAIPGVATVGLASSRPLEGTMRLPVVIRGHEPPPGEYVSMAVTMASPNYFQTLGIRVLHGRDFSATDVAGAEPIVIVNQAMAERFWPGKDPVGQTIDALGPQQHLRVVGLVNDVVSADLSAPAPAVVYVPLAQFYQVFPWQPPVFLFARSARSPMALGQAIQQAVARLDSGLPVFELRPLHDQLGAVLGRQRLLAALFSALGGLALLIVGAGLFGLVSLLVQGRRRDYGIRAALGAKPSRIFFSIVLRSSIVGSIGAAVGLSAAALGSRTLAGFLYGVAPHDTATYVAVAVALMAVSILASAMPAMRAAWSNPSLALRSETGRS